MLLLCLPALVILYNSHQFGEITFSPSWLSLLLWEGMQCLCRIEAQQHFSSDTSAFLKKTFNRNMCSSLDEYLRVIYGSQMWHCPDRDTRGAINVFDALQKGNLINPIWTSPVAQFKPCSILCLHFKAFSPSLERRAGPFVTSLGSDEWRRCWDEGDTVSANYISALTSATSLWLF